MNIDARTVYVIDDDESVRKALGRLLRAAGFRVETFASGGEFLSRLDGIEHGCLIVDIRMPGETGHDVQARLAKRRMDVPVIAISAHDGQCNTGTSAPPGRSVLLQKACRRSGSD